MAEEPLSISHLESDAAALATREGLVALIAALASSGKLSIAAAGELIGRLRDQRDHFQHAYPEDAFAQAVVRRLEELDARIRNELAQVHVRREMQRREQRRATAAETAADGDVPAPRLQLHKGDPPRPGRGKGGRPRKGKAP